MMTPPRWEVECRLMDANFPQLEPFSENGVAGFRGFLEGPQSGRLYGIVSWAAIPDYPQAPPKVQMNPHAETHHPSENAKKNSKVRGHLDVKGNDAEWTGTSLNWNHSPKTAWLDFAAFSKAPKAGGYTALSFGQPFPTIRRLRPKCR